MKQCKKCGEPTKKVICERCKNRRESLRRVEQSARYRLKKAKARERTQCLCCKSFNEKDEMHNKNVCKWCVEHIKDWKLHEKKAIAKMNKV